MGLFEFISDQELQYVVEDCPAQLEAPRSTIIQCGTGTIIPAVALPGNFSTSHPVDTRVTTINNNRIRRPGPVEEKEELEEWPQSGPA
jgi:hypothetical protein